MHMVQESMLLEGEVEAMVLKYCLSHLLVAIAIESILFVCA